MEALTPEAIKKGIKFLMEQNDKEPLNVNMRIDINNFKIKYVTEKEGKELRGDMRFHPAYYSSYGNATILFEGEIGCIDQLKTRYIIKGE